MNLKCSPGYYDKVLKPCLQILFSPGFNQRVEGQLIDISMPDPPVLDRDSSGLTETMMYRVILSLDSRTLGIVVMHLHTTTQLLQVQGGATMLDKRSAAVWFSELLLMPGLAQFSNRNEFKKAEIKKVHQAIIKAFSKPLTPAPSSGQVQELPGLTLDGGRKHCWKCQKQLDGRANPRPCLSCEQIFHTDCWKTHVKSCTVSQATTPTTSTPTSSSSTTTISSSTSSLILRPSALTNVVQSYTPAATGTGQQLILGQLARLTTSPAPPAAALPPVSCAPSAPLHALALAQPAARPAARPPAPRRQAPRRQGLQLTPGGLDKELLERELTVAKVKITSLDNRLSEEESRNKILLERIRMFENRENTAAYHQHFPPPAAESSSPPALPDTPPPPPATPPPSSASLLLSSCSSPLMLLRLWPLNCSD